MHVYMYIWCNVAQFIGFYNVYQNNRFFFRLHVVSQKRWLFLINFI